MTAHRIERGPGWELREGRWQDVLADVTCDALVTDPPYSERTHAGHDAGATLANRGDWERSDGKLDRCRARTELSYASWNREDVDAFTESWAPRNRGWFVALSDSELCGDYRQSFESRGLTGFHPLPCVIRGMTVRLSGDGPSSWAIYANVARPKALSKWGTLDGAYSSGQGERAHIGGKPLNLMRAIIRDYTRPGDLVVDPCAGGGTTLLAAVMEGRRAIGAEMDAATFDKAVARLRKGYTAPLFSDAPARMEQTGLSFPVEPEPADEPIDREPERPGYTDDELCAIEMVSRMEARA